MRLHPRLASDAVAIARYQAIKQADFRKLVIGAFQQQGFSLRSINIAKDGRALYNLSYPVATGGPVQNVDVVVRADENLDKDRRCVNCFLRAATLPDIDQLQASPWMLQYQLSQQVFPAIDQAYASIRTNGRASMDAAYGFGYRNQWSGEKNLYQNSFVGITPADLSAKILGAYQAAGFTLVSDAKPNAAASEWLFSYPISPGQTEGVVYKITTASQWDADGRCFPCEISEDYDPHQRLPAAGLSGMANRLTLESRFSAARAQALEALKNATTPYLRPGTQFTTPPQPAALGSPRPQVRPMVVT